MSARDCRVDGNSYRRSDNRVLNAAIARVANRQGGVISRQQLIARGLDRAGIDNRVKIGFLRAVHRGVYAVGHDAIPIRGRLCAALLVAGPHSALSHRTAAHVLALLPTMPAFVEVTTTTRRRANRPGLVFHHAAGLPTTTRHGLPTTTPLRTLLDLAATRHRDLERAASEALVSKLVTEHELQTQHGPGSEQLRRLVVGPTRSRFERAFLKALFASGLPRPLTNHPIGPYEADFYWPSHDLVVETDGDRYHDHALARRRDAAKDAYLRQRGLNVMRVREVEGGIAAVAAILSAPATRTAS